MSPTELFGIARRDQQFVAGRAPVARERTADVTRADDAYLQRMGRLGRVCRERCEG
jgi:hypothetical protein